MPNTIVPKNWREHVALVGMGLIMPACVSAARAGLDTNEYETFLSERDREQIAALECLRVLLEQQEKELTKKKQSIRTVIKNYFESKSKRLYIQEDIGIIRTLEPGDTYTLSTSMESLTPGGHGPVIFEMVYIWDGETLLKKSYKK